MSNRRGMSDFTPSYSRRPTDSGTAPSLLGDPPRRQGQGFGNYGGGGMSGRDDHYGSAGQQSRQGYSGDTGTGRRGEGTVYDYGHGHAELRNPVREKGGSYQNASYGMQGSRQREPGFGGNRGGQDISPWNTNSGTGRSASPVTRHAGFSRGGDYEDNQRMRSASNAWTGGGGMGQNSVQSLSMAGLGSLSQNLGNRQGTQPVVMVVPPTTQNRAGGMMDMMGGGDQNPFNVLQGQTPMQVILGNLPAFNQNAFGQQLLTAAANAQFGQNQMRMMGNGNQRSDRNQFNRPSYDRDGSNRSRIVRQRSSAGPGTGTSSGRRPDSSRTLVLRNGRGSNSVAASASQRGRKRGYSDRPTNDADKKRFKVGSSGAKEKVARGTVSTSRKAQQGKPQKKSDGAKNGASTAVKGTVVKGEPSSDSTQDNDNKEDEKTNEPADETANTSVSAETDAKVDGGETNEKASEEKPKKKSKYEEVPAELMVCKVCQKTMNDAGSFESHLNGRAHQSLVRILDQRFQKRVDVLMTDSKLNEEEIAIEVERQRRAGKQTQTGNKNKNFCKMCDCNYAVNWGTHKVSLGHRILKEFLHPSCRICEINFVQRLDWINHLTDVSHLKKIVQLQDEGRDWAEDCSTAQDQLFAINLDLSKEEHVSNCVTIRNANWKIPSKDDLKSVLDNDTRDLVGPDEEIVIPKMHDDTVPFATHSITAVNGFSCKVCRIYLVSQKDVDIHCKSSSHFGMYCGFLRKLAKHREQLKEEAKTAEAEKEAAEAKAKEAEAGEQDGEAAAGGDGETTGTSNDGVEGVVDLANDTVKTQDVSEIIDDGQGDEEMDAAYNVVEDELGEEDEDELLKPDEPSSSTTSEGAPNTPKCAVTPVEPQAQGVVEKTETEAKPAAKEPVPPVVKQEVSTPAPANRRGTNPPRSRGNRPGSVTPGRGQAQNNSNRGQTPGARARGGRGNSGMAGRRGGGVWERSRGRGRPLR